MLKFTEMEAPHESEQLMQDEEIPASNQRAVMNMKCLKALRTERCGPRHVMLMLGFASCLLALGLNKVMPWGKVNVPIQGDILQNWEFEDVNLHSGDKVFDMLFNRTLFQCIEPVKHVAEKRGRCYDTIFKRQRRCKALRQEDPPASCDRVVECLKGNKDVKPPNPCDWLCTWGTDDQKAVKEECMKHLHKSWKWDGSCLEDGYVNKSLEAMAKVNSLSQQCSDHTTTTTTPGATNLYCWALVVPFTNEVELLLMQQKVKKGIFECDAYEVYSDREMNIGGVTTVHVDTDLHCKMNKVTLTVENTHIFHAVWQKVLDNMVWNNYDWTVKVDLDSVFMPLRMLHYVQSDPWIREHAQKGTGLWLNNCWRGLHGPIEVLSHLAMKTYKSREQQCDQVAQQKPQEDVYLQECLNTVGIWKADLKYLLAEDHCDHPDYWKCEGNFVAYHPFKEPAKWMECRKKLE